MLLYLFLILSNIICNHNYLVYHQFWSYGHGGLQDFFWVVWRHIWLWRSRQFRQRRKWGERFVRYDGIFIWYINKRETYYFDALIYFLFTVISLLLFYFDLFYCFVFISIILIYIKGKLRAYSEFL